MKNTLTICTLMALISSFQFYRIEPKQIIKTSLHIEVRNELGNVEEGVKVRIFKSKEDYDKLANAIETKPTDAKGKVSFKDLDPIVYYINAEKGSKNNYGAGEKTEILAPNKMNKIVVIISE